MIYPNTLARFLNRGHLQKYDSIMKRSFYAILFTLAVMFTHTTAVWAQQTVTPDTEVETKKRAQTGMKFLSTSVDARAAGIGGAVTAEMQGSSVSLFYNPASMAGMDGTFDINIGILPFITDIDYNILSMAYRPSGGNYGVFGFSVVSVDYGEFNGTIRASNTDGFVETGSYSPTALAVGVGYARAFSDRFAAGLHAKYAFQDIGDGFVVTQDFDAQSGDSFDESAVNSTEDFSKGTIAIDFGIVYYTGFRSLNIAMSARNFSRELSYVRERFELPLTFQVGVSMDMIDFTSADPNMHSLMLHVDATRPRDFTEHVRFGLEYTFMNMVSIRGGYEQMISEEQGISLGAGFDFAVQNVNVTANYAWTDFGLFGSINRFGLGIGF